MFIGSVFLIIMYLILMYIIAWIKYFNNLDSRLGDSTWRFSYDYPVSGERDISDLDDKKQKSALHVLNNMPKRLLSKTLALQPKLPTVPAANPILLENLRKH